MTKLTPEERLEREQEVREAVAKMTPAEREEYDRALDELYAALAASCRSLTSRKRLRSRRIVHTATKQWTRLL